jgi:hypothetical protein
MLLLSTADYSYLPSLYMYPRLNQILLDRGLQEILHHIQTQILCQKVNYTSSMSHKIHNFNVYGLSWKNIYLWKINMKDRALQCCNTGHKFVLDECFLNKASNIFIRFIIYWEKKERWSVQLNIHFYKSHIREHIGIGQYF